ncbi:MAG TPA: HYR domain-containing protein, partial [Candidatus Limnocylindrales bacterium]|nr:HYR domain-containing protein [Candidatus Limnocylindrales bacterium]
MTQTKLSSGAVRALFFAVFLCVNSLIGVSFAAAQATVQTDKADYYPGETAIVTGSGWTPGETVSLTFDESPAQHPPVVQSAVADASGDIRNEYLLDDTDLGVTYTLTAVGETSGLTAVATFTDSPKVGSVEVGAQTGSLCSGTGGNVTYSIKVKRGSGSGSSGNFLADLFASVLPAGTTAVFAVNPVQVPSQSDSATTTLTLTTTAGTPGGTFTFRVKASTSASDSAFTTATLQVNAGPAITCPANISVSNAPGTCAANVSFAATATGTPAPTITYSPASGSSFPVGTTTVTATATNSCSSASCTFTVTVNDTEKPVLSAHANVTATNSPGLCSAVVTFAPPTATDNCPSVGVVSSSPASGSVFPVGVTTVTNTVTDAHGNTQTSTFTVTVTDTEKPVLGAHANIAVNNDAGLCAAAVTFAPPTATDNCPGVGVVSSSPASGSVFPVGVTTVTNTVSDAHGNTQTSTFTVTVTDTEKPALSAHANISVNNDAGLCSALVSFSPPTATDNCPGVGLVSSSPASGSVFPVGTTTVTSTVTDAHGNTQTSTFTVTVNDTEKPVLSAHADIAVNNDAGLCSALVSFSPPPATDN